MEYKCKSIGFERTLVGPLGVVEPLCNSCKCKDCSNPIETRPASVMGVIKALRLLMRGDTPYVVITCEGYTP